MAPLLAEKEPGEVPMEWCSWVRHGGSSNKVTLARNLNLLQGDMVRVS